MTALHRSRAFLRSYAFMPHRLLNRGAARLTATKRPAWAVDRAVDLWVRRDGIDLGDFEARRFESLDDFFLRRLRPGARPLGPGFVAPADGNLIATGTLSPDRGLRPSAPSYSLRSLRARAILAHALRLDQQLVVKGQRLSLDRVVNAGLHDLDLSPYDGGSFAVIFLTPRGYHRVHMPLGGEVLDVRWIPGRYFPQN